MKRIFLPLLVLLFTIFNVQAAYLKNVPQTVVQPNGDTLHCFASGDEFFHYLHDAEGFTIVLNPETGYFVYAKKENGRLMPTEFVAGSVRPAEVGLSPHALISNAEWQQRRTRMLAPLAESPAQPLRDVEFNHGDINNLVIFIRFAGDEPFEQTYGYVNNMFNDSTSFNANSMFSYFRSNSYNQLHVRSYLIPQSTDNTIVSYEDIYPRSYYMPMSATNPDGYDDENESDNSTTREMGLLVRAVNYVNSNHMVPSDLNIDYNGDGLVDNICFLVRGRVAGWNDLLWPHRWCLYTDEVVINNKRVYDFNFELSDDTWYFENSTLCHEMSHTLGAPDLYHYADAVGFDPVGGWDLMSQNAYEPQHWGTYMKYKYGNWIDEIPTITQSGKYTLYPVSSATPQKVAYRINSEDPDEFFIIEFRDITGTFEHYLPRGGVIIYRINSNFDGNAGWNGDDILDEIYIYRPGGTLDNDGDVNSASYAQVVHRTELNYTTDPQPFLSNGYVSSLNICEITLIRRDSATFWYLRPGDTIPAEIRDHHAEIKLFPSPASSQFSVTAGGSQMETLEVFDMGGKCVFRTQPRKETEIINVNNWTPGIYLVRIQTRQGILQEKITIQ